MAHAPSRADDLQFESRQDYETHVQTFHGFAWGVLLFAALVLAVLALMAIILV